MSRTIITSGLTFLTVLALFVFGGSTINNFAFAMVVGIIIGTYSSIAIAAPLVLVYTNLRGGTVGRACRGSGDAPAAAKAPRHAKVKQRRLTGWAGR